MPCYGLSFTASIAAQTGNVGIGTSAPSSKLSVNGNMSVGAGYTGTAAPANGSIIEGNVGIGTSAPATKLDVMGQVKITDGTQGLGKVLTSNANGAATWEAPKLVKAIVNYINDGVVTVPAGTTSGAGIIQGNVNIVFPENGTYAVSFDYVGDITNYITDSNAWVSSVLRDSSGNSYLNHVDYIPQGTNYAFASATKYITITNAPITLQVWIYNACSYPFTLRPNSGKNYNEWFAYKVF
ncbi:hypothetical protein [Chryseobacterium wanjuense]